MKLAPELEPMHLLLARTYEALGQSARAKAEFTEVRRLQKARVESYQKLLESEIPKPQ